MESSKAEELDLDSYRTVREEGAPWVVREQKGIIAVTGGEAVQFLNGLVTNDVEKLQDGRSMLAAFPNAKGRMLALATVERNGDRFVLVTEPETYPFLLENLQRFTFAGDFHVEDLTAAENILTIRGAGAALTVERVLGTAPVADAVTEIGFNGAQVTTLPVWRTEGFDIRVPADASDDLEAALINEGAVAADGALAEVLRVESGLPRFGTDMNEETVVPEVGLEDMISYNKGCYIGQEVIARIHFRGKVAKELTGIAFDSVEAAFGPGDEIVSSDGKNAGTVTSTVWSPILAKRIALAYVRNAYIDTGTELKVGEYVGRVVGLPFAN